MSETAAGVEVKGTAYIQLEVECRRALSWLTEGWTDEEKQALLDGDEEAKQALKDDLLTEALKSPDDVDDFDFELWISES